MWFIDFLRYILGYVTISVSGEFPEKLMNILSINKMPFWDIKREDKTLFFSILVTDFKKIKNLKEKNKFRIKIVRKAGIKFIIKRYFKRIGIPIGISIFLLILSVLSLFIWNIEIEGNVYVDAEEIMKNAKEIGVKNGARISKINSQLFREKMLLKNEKLAWCSFNIEGSKITINVSEISNNEKNFPTNLVSDYDGIITDIMVESGYANFKKGDVVKKGDILVSGTNKVDFNNKFVKSKAEIKALVSEIIEVNGRFSGEKTERSGELKKQYILEFFTFKIPLSLGRIKGNFEKEENLKTFFLFGKKMPVSMISETYYFLECSKFEIERDALLQSLEEDMREEINRLTNKYEVISRNIQEKDDELTLIYEIKFLKNIGIEEKILFNVLN